MKLAIVGCTGLVGNEVLNVLDELSTSVTELILVASEKNIGKKALLKTGKIIQDFENAVGMDTIDLLLNGYMIYSAIENPQGVFKKNKGSSSTSSSSTVTKSLGSGSGSVLDREFGGQSLKRLIAISRR